MRAVRTSAAYHSAIRLRNLSGRCLAVIVELLIVFPVPFAGAQAQAGHGQGGRSEVIQPVTAVVERWALSFKRRDIQQHLTCYGPHLTRYFTWQDVPFNRVATDKRRAFAEIENVSQYEVYSLQIETSPGGGAVATFGKRWDIGLRGNRRFSGDEIQQLGFENFGPAGWKITSERELHVLRVSRPKNSSPLRTDIASLRSFQPKNLPKAVDPGNRALHTESDPSRNRTRGITLIAVVAIVGVLTIFRFVQSRRGSPALGTIPPPGARERVPATDSPAVEVVRSTDPDVDRESSPRPLFEEPIGVEEIHWEVAPGPIDPAVKSNAGGANEDFSVPAHNCAGIHDAASEARCPDGSLKGSLANPDVELGVLFRLAAQELGSAIANSLRQNGNIGSDVNPNVNDIFALDVRQVILEFGAAVGEIGAQDGKLFMDIMNELKPSWYDSLRCSNPVLLLSEEHQPLDLRVPWTLKAMYQLNALNTKYVEQTRALVAVYVRLILDLADIHANAPDREFVVLRFLGRFGSVNTGELAA